MTPKSLVLICTLSLILLLSSCKFFFSESEYLGTYIGGFTTGSTLYKNCNAQLIITDVGDNIVNLELISDSNATFYFNGVKIERGYSLNSSDLRINSGDIEAYLSRTTHDVTLYYYPGSSYYDFRFNGTRQ